MKILKIKALLLAFLFVSCDPYTGASIANNSNKKIAVNIKYNDDNQSIKDYMKTHNGFENFVKFITDYQGYNGKPISIDSSKHIATFELNQKDTLVIWGGIRQSNDFDEIEEIIINSNKKQTTIKGEDFQDIFDKNQTFYIYTVK
jgi:phage anti-repressor protein